MNAKSADHNLGWHNEGKVVGCPTCERVRAMKEDGMSKGASEEANRVAREALEKSGLSQQALPSVFAEAARKGDFKGIGMAAEDGELPKPKE